MNIDHKKFNVLLHGGLYSPFVMSLLFGSSIFTTWPTHALFSLSMYALGANIGHYMFRGPIADLTGLTNVPLADRRFFFDLNVRSNLTSIIKMDRIDDMPAFAEKVRNHFMQYDRCRSRVINFGYHLFFEKVKAEKMVEILDEMTEEEAF